MKINEVEAAVGRSVSTVSRVRSNVTILFFI